MRTERHQFFEPALTFHTDRLTSYAIFPMMVLHVRGGECPQRFRANVT